MKHLSSIEINQAHLLHNYQTLKSLVNPGTLLACVVKGNAYGHGQAEIVRLLDPVIDYFAVDDARELALLRNNSQKPTLVLGYVAKHELEEIVVNQGEPILYDLERLPLLEHCGSAHKMTVPIHLKVDALLGRQGLLPEDVPRFLHLLKKCPHLKLAGLSAHFANIEDTSDFSHAQKQINLFNQVVRDAQDLGFSQFLTHQSATSGLFTFEQVGQNPLIRPGIGLYGLWPSEDLRQKYEKENSTLLPVLRWVTHIAQIKALPAGHPVGYGLTFITQEPTKVAIIPQGYSDGYDRGLSNCGEVLIGGLRCPILGRVMMNMFVVNISHLPKVAVEDEVVLLGQQEDERITAEEIAHKLGTINYEVTTRISPLLPRVTT